MNRAPAGAVWWVCCALLLVHALLVARLAYTTGITVDEPVLLAGGAEILSERGFADPFTRFQGPLPLYANQLFTSGRAATELSVEHVFLARLGLLPFSLLLGIVLVLWAREAFGASAQLAVAALFALQPMLLAYGGLLAVDLAHTACVTLALYLLWRCWMRPSLGRGAATAVALGASLATKYLALLMVPFHAVVVLWIAWHAARRQRSALRIASSGGALLLFGVLALATLHAAYLFRGGFSVRDAGAYESPLVRQWIERPIAAEAMALLPQPFLLGVDFQFAVSRDEHQTYFCQRYGLGHPAYYVVALAAKTPELIFLLMAYALVRLVRTRGMRVHRAQQTIAYLAAAITVPLLYLSFFNRVQIGIRYVLPLIPLFLLIAAAAWRGVVRRSTWVSTALVLLILGVDIGARWPHLLSYFNTVSGGPAHAWRKFSDSNCDWGELRQRGLELLRSEHGASFDVIAEADGPRFGKLAIHVDQLDAPDPRDAKRAYTWLALFPPIDHIGAAWFLFDVTPKSFAHAAAQATDTRHQRDYAIAELGAQRTAAARAWLARSDVEIPPEEREAFLLLISNVEREDPSGSEELASVLRTATAWRRLGRMDLAREKLQDPALGQHPEVLGELVLSLVAEGERREAIEVLEGSSKLTDQETFAVLLFHLYSEVARFADAIRWIEPRLDRLSPPLRSLVEQKLKEQRTLRDANERYHESR